MGGERLSNLRFADDVVIIANNVRELTEMINEINKLGKQAGLNINMTKTKILTKNTETEIRIDNAAIEKVTEITYLGQTIAFENGTEKEVNKRITLTWKKFWSLKYIFKAPFSNYQKSQIFNSCIVPTLTYGSQTWTLTKKISERIIKTQNSLERSILNIRLTDKISINIIK